MDKEFQQQHFLYRSEIEPHARYRAPTQSFLVCIFCCKVVMPGSIIFDVSETDIAHDECGSDFEYPEE